MLTLPFVGEAQRAGAELRPQAVDLTQERFLVYVPAQHRSQGYALMVFIAPWQDAQLPRGWAPILDDHGMIFVSAAKSGNEENVLGISIWRRAADISRLACCNRQKVHCLATRA
jgi:hypothetical protein